jgi:hypothetical protein
MGKAGFGDMAREALKLMVESGILEGELDTQSVV